MSNRIRIDLVQGPNLNLVGSREPAIYGSSDLNVLLAEMKNDLAGFGVDLVLFQSNHEGELVDQIQHVGFTSAGIVLNPGGFTHTSVAIRDAVAAIASPVVEVHLSAIHRREQFRHKSLVAPVAAATIAGLGPAGYRNAVDWLVARARSN